MPITDTIADMLTRIRNANQAQHKEVEVPQSRVKLEIAKILKEEGYIRSYTSIKKDSQDVIKIELKYDSSKKGVISVIRRISKPALRRYVKKDKIPKVLNGLGLAILSTSKGIVSDRKARELCVGGELICTVY
ncbi:MAG: 30S ribosomal protein S8 [Deltaproteobacteria bacterium GWC2_42_51]|nr:MAG: 30S ribosomal protein S8 [Deltaproteobacteria bacterium GWA2_42_85]OGP32696.1 MAG: 30S ribosomal protein S8 [Deltaproteobacteria bacterium GWC2_42_51]OGP39114.1 MAG: 30S ribosomal protein S8 [Deltaproteobacteria bacterium GWD2_42_10]OGP47952.1 MAG: 30S ribosomal protein S8 [Deltaproteobacteria bacterium GWF2_42_12]OGQ24781.1 MAG: 30S ribosomal protein S8 [Deltaproteobacteria bacterium RIFCSPHIGHO2_02_FULL_42_44]OGQ36829.1 MAG: 30S ribosomal protein S8 [Deltaproteobacteria bacterium RIF